LLLAGDYECGNEFPEPSFAWRSLLIALKNCNRHSGSYRRFLVTA
jgi:hypothetical protein